MINAVEKPTEPDQCWAIGYQKKNAIVPEGRAHCSKKARTGRLTCWRHKVLEGKALDLKADLENRQKSS